MYQNIVVILIQLQLNPTFIGDDESCGCNVFECGPQAANAYRYSIENDLKSIVILLALIVVVL